MTTHKQMRDERMRYAEGACTFCGSDNLTTLQASAFLKERVGCLACNKWLTEERPQPVHRRKE